MDEWESLDDRSTSDGIEWVEVHRSGEHRELTGIATTLAAEGFDVRLLDAEGHPLSEPEPEPGPVPRAAAVAVRAEDVADVVEALPELVEEQFWFDERLERRAAMAGRLQRIVLLLVGLILVAVAVAGVVRRSVGAESGAVVPGLDDTERTSAARSVPRSSQGTGPDPAARPCGELALRRPLTPPLTPTDRPWMAPGRPVSSMAAPPTVTGRRWTQPAVTVRWARSGPIGTPGRDDGRSSRCASEVA